MKVTEWYVLQQPRTLESMALQALGEWVVAQSEKVLAPLSTLRGPWKPLLADEELISRRTELIRTHIARRLPKVFHDGLIKVAITALISMQSTTGYWLGRMIEALFTKHVTSLVFDEDGLGDDYLIRSSFNKSVYYQSYLLTGLTHLEIHSLEYKHNPRMNCHLFLGLRGLKCLVTSNLLSLNEIQCIVENCTSIETLHLDCWDGIYDDSLNILCQLRDLRSIHVQSRNVSPAGIASLLVSCPNLEHIGSWFCIIGVLRHIASKEDNVGKKFKLKSYRNINESYLEHIKLIVQMCPLIQKLNFFTDGYMDPVDFIVKPLADLQELIDLELNTYHFYDAQIKDLLEVKGRSLKHLRLVYVFEIDTDALEYIVLMCPNLESLTIRYKSREGRCSEHYLFPIKVDIPPLIYLKSLTLIDEEDSVFTGEQLMFLLSKCPNVEFIDISEVTEWYVLQQPRTLESMALQALGEWVVAQSEKVLAPLSTLRGPWKPLLADEELISRRTELIRTHIARRLPKVFHDGLIKVAITALISMQSTTGYWLGRMIEALFTKHVTSLVFDEDGLGDDYLIRSSFNKSVYYQSYLLTGLTHLEIHSLEYKHNPRMNCHLFLGLRGLKCLVTSNLLSLNEIQCIVENCTSIETLHLDCWDGIYDDSLNILCQLRDLRSIHVQSRNVSPAGIASLLVSCPNLEHIGSWFCIIGVLRHIASKEDNVGKKFKLKSYRNINESYLEHIKLIVQMCPLIQKLNFFTDGYMDPVDFIVKPLADLQELIDLELNTYHFYDAQIKDLLEVKGRSLKHLRLVYVFEIDTDALEYIVLMCPNLESLTIRYKSREGRCSEHYLFPIKVDIPPLIYLKSLTLIDEEDSVFTGEQLMFLLSKCPNVEFIDISEVSWLEDDMILEVLDQHPEHLNYLKVLKIYDNLSESVIDRIVENCAGPPEILSIVP